MYIPNLGPLALQVDTKAAQIRAHQKEFSQALLRLERLEVSDETKAIFQGYLNGELTISDLNAAIDGHLNGKK